MPYNRHSRRQAHHPPSGNGTLFIDTSEYPEKQTACGEYKQVCITYGSEWQRSYRCRTSQHKEYIEDVAPDYISRAIPVLPFRAAVIEVASSGKDVPAATIVRPITASLTPNPAAIPERRPQTCRRRKSVPKTTCHPQPCLPHRHFSLRLTAFCRRVAGCGMPGRGEGVMHEHHKEKQQDYTVNPRQHIGFRTVKERGVAHCQQNGAESITSGISVVRILFEIRIGRTRDVIPIMAHTLKILLPTTLPIASPAFPSTADITLITSSGRRGAERHDCESDNKIRHSPPLGKRRRAIGKRVCSHKNQHKTQYEEILYSES